jgi:glycerophosphoryl diester phosphodiesterase
VPGRPARAFDLQGHRAARGLAPENTLPAFAKALSIGVTTLELDVGLTRDGVLVGLHDPSLNPDITRGPDGAFLAARGPFIWQSTLQELQRHDVGRINPASRYAQTFATQQPAGRHAHPAPGRPLRARWSAPARATCVSTSRPRSTRASPRPRPRPSLSRARWSPRSAMPGSRAAPPSSPSTWRTLQIVQREAPEIDTVYLSAQQRWLDNIGAGAAAALCRGPPACASPTTAPCRRW